MERLGPADLRLMQGLAQEVTALCPELINGDASVGELAWVWAKDFDALGSFCRHRLWFVEKRLAAWGWAYLPHRVARSDGQVCEVKSASLIWQTHPDRSELLAEILDWYDGVAGGVDRSMTVQSGDVKAQAIVAAHGYAFDAETGSDSGSWHQFNARELTDLRIRSCRADSGSCPPPTFRSRTRSRPIATPGIRRASPRRRSSGSGGPGRIEPICTC